MNRFAVCTAALALVLAPAKADSLADTFAHIDSASKSFKGMTSKVTETVYAALVKNTDVSDGEIKLKRNKPGDVRTLVTFTQPRQQIISFDGNQAKIYSPKNKTAEAYDVASRREMVEALLALGFGASSAELKASYDVTYVGPDTIDGKKTSHLKLVPKSKDMLKTFREADLWVSDSLGVPLQQKFVTSSDGNYTQFTYSGLTLNSSLSDKDLQLKLPKDVQIKQVGH